ncbi:quinon protein alcohol dehydrogenase-like superfamily [Scenedesmus sp. NREL 46B-D3]|nr:quinon protein alcohol dehydrogenase-like superfamily [Scenedesmus sp. NREL 46B-D3]
MQQQAVLLACSTESNITAWDLATATQLTQFKGNASGRGRVCRLGSDYLAAAQNSKDAIHFWAWHKDQVLQRCFTQEPMTALAASPNGCYLVGGGSSGSLYCWETATGRLLRSWPAHYKAVSCLAFSDSGGLLVSAGEDTLVAAWLLAEVLDEQRDGPAAAAAAAAVGMARVEPLHTWSEHTLPVTCIHLGCGEGSALLATASLDRCVKLWSLATGQLLRTITLPAGVASVTLDAGEHVLLAGCVDGSIWEAPLAGQPLAAPAAAGSGAAAAASDAAAAAGVVGGPGSCCYEGHSKAISSLAITPDGEQLVSGSEDGTARIWDCAAGSACAASAAPARPRSAPRCC